MTQHLTLTKAAMAVLGKRGVIRDAVTEIKTAKPSVCQVQMYLFTQPPLRPDAKAIADQKHPDQQLGINRWSPCVTVKLRQMRPNATQIDEPIYGP